MPLDASPVGPLQIPVDGGGYLSTLGDPVALALLDYLGFWLKDSLDGQLSQLPGTSADACPAGNRYAFNPDTYFVRNTFPALYVWWDGKSTRQYHTLLFERRERTMHALYVYEELVAPSGIRARAGLPAAVDAIFAKASERGRHPGFGLGAAPPGTPLWQSLGLLKFDYDGGQAGFIAKIPNTSPVPGGPPEGSIVRGYPALRGTFTVWERIDPATTQDPQDLAGDVLVNIATNESGDLDNSVDVMDRYAPAPDGSDALGE